MLLKYFSELSSVISAGPAPAATGAPGLPKYRPGHFGAVRRPFRQRTGRALAAIASPVRRSTPRKCNIFVISHRGTHLHARDPVKQIYSFFRLGEPPPSRSRAGDRQKKTKKMKKTTNEELHRPTAEAYARMRKMPVTVVLDNIRSLNNVGSFFRTCDAFAVERLLLCGITGTPPSRELHKTALGAEHTVAWRYFDDTLQALAALRSEGYTLLAVEQAESAVMLQEFRPAPDKRYALVFGNEVEGVAQEAADMCDGAIEIPQAGTKHSLNVSVAGGAVLWHLFAQYLSEKSVAGETV
jgi:tRNA G18 (ribose-2'-O)-methylase SpoU